VGSARPWGCDEDQRLVEMWAQGIPVREISDLIGRSVGAVQQRAGNLRKAGVNLKSREKMYEPDVRALNRIIEREAGD